MTIEQERDIAVKALKRIQRWIGEFPSTKQTWDDGSPMSYGAAFGSNGERDYMRNVATEALAAISAQASPMAQDERSQFEAWWLNEHFGAYKESMWAAWNERASRVSIVVPDMKVEQTEHKQGCDALGGYGHGVGSCSCGAVPAAQPVGEAVAYVSASEFAKLADNRVAGIGMMLSKEPADGRIALYTGSASTKPPSTGPEIANAVQSLIRAALDCGQVVTIHLEPGDPLSMGSYEMVYEVRPARVRS